MENDFSTEIEQFVAWASHTPKTTGAGFYSEKMIRHHYVRALKRGIISFDCDINPKSNFFAVQDVDSMIAIRDKLYATDGFAEFCRNGDGITGQNDLSAALDLYIRFLGRDVEDFGSASIDEQKEDGVVDEGLSSPKHWECVPVIKTNKTVRSMAVIKRSVAVYQNALAKAHHVCELCHEETFLNKSTNLPYVEGHHLIPLSCNDLFPFSLDVEENVIALCPNCHMKLHHGVEDDIHDLLMTLFKARKAGLKKRGIELSYSMLASFYK